MTLKQLDTMIDDLAERHGLSYQLTALWLCENGIDRLKFSAVTLSPQQLEKLCTFARA